MQVNIVSNVKTSENKQNLHTFNNLFNKLHTEEKKMNRNSYQHRSSKLNILESVASYTKTIFATWELKPAYCKQIGVAISKGFLHK